MRRFLILQLILFACLTASVISCDNPKSIAWSYFYCAKDTLDAGDPYAAKVYLKACKKSVDSELSSKVDSLMTVIDQAIKEEEASKE